MNSHAGDSGGNGKERGVAVKLILTVKHKCQSGNGDPNMFACIELLLDRQSLLTLFLFMNRKHLKLSVFFVEDLSA